jgi:hypothetical protein
MIFDKEETKNLLNMLRSSDTENATIAFEALKGVDTKKYIGELITLYKFGKHNLGEWVAYCPTAGEAIKEGIKLFTTDESFGAMSTGACLSAITANNSSNQSIELFMELFTDSMIGFLGQMGYPADRFEINIKLKDGQTTKS